MRTLIAAVIVLPFILTDIPKAWAGYDYASGLKAEEIIVKGTILGKAEHQL